MSEPEDVSRMPAGQLTGLGLWKVSLLCLAAGIGLVGSVFSLLALIGFNTVRYSGRPVHGVEGLLLGAWIGLLMFVFMGLVAGVGAWAVSHVPALRRVSLRVRSPLAPPPQHPA